MRASKLLDDRGDILGEQHVRDVLRAIGVPRFDGEQDRGFRPGLVAFGEQAGDERGVMLDHAGGAPDLHAPPIGVVHQKNQGARVLLEIARGDVLAVAAEIGEGERRLVEHAQEAGRAAAMLDIRLPVLAGGGEIERSHVRDEVGQDGSIVVAKPPFCFHARIGGRASRAVPARL